MKYRRTAAEFVAGSNNVVDEFGLIERYFRFSKESAGVALGIGDDCALLEAPAGSQLAVSMDTLVSGVHFLADSPPKLIAERALRVTVSDLAAMGASPLWMTLGLTLPYSDDEWLSEFSDGLKAAASEIGISLVGGDTTRGPLTITIQVHGAVPAGQALRRSGASPGDRVYVTGRLGDGAASLQVLLDRVSTVDCPDRDYLVQRYYRPQPRIEEGRQLLSLASSAIDISDGLVADLEHICKASEVGALIDVDCLPVSHAASSVLGQYEVIESALSGGDDYELCFTVPSSNWQKMDELIEAREIDATEIGRIESGSGIKCWHKAQPYPIKKRGYNHFQ